MRTLVFTVLMTWTVTSAAAQEPPPAEDDAAQRKLFGYLDDVSAARGWDYNPGTMIRAVNALLPLGKEKALETIEAYLARGKNRIPGDDNQAVFLLLRVLFEVPEKDGHMPSLALGAPGPSEPADPKAIPRWPVAIVDDIPFLLISGYSLFGMQEPVQNNIGYFKAMGVLRKNSLRPPEDPVCAARNLFKKLDWLYPKKFGEYPDNHTARLMIASQVLNMCQDRLGLGELVRSHNYPDLDLVGRNFKSSAGRHVWDERRGKYAAPELPAGLNSIPGAAVLRDDEEESDQEDSVP